MRTSPPVWRLLAATLPPKVEMNKKRESELAHLKTEMEDAIKGKAELDNTGKLIQGKPCGLLMIKLGNIVQLNH